MTELPVGESTFETNKDPASGNLLALTKKLSDRDFALALAALLVYGSLELWNAGLAKGFVYIATKWFEEVILLCSC